MSNPLLLILLATQFAAVIAAGQCKPTDLRTPAVYLEHLGDSDKPIFPIVIATAPPPEQELHCALPSMWMSAEVFVVADEEFAQAARLTRQGGSADEKAGFTGFLYRIVSKPAATETGLLDLKRSEQLLGALASYFKGRQPRLQHHLEVTLRRL
jgi:hypothetical protein